MALSSEPEEERVQKNRRQLQEQIYIKNDSLCIIFRKISKLEYLSNACACPDLADESKIQVSRLYEALICDEIDTTAARWERSEKLAKSWWITSLFLFQWWCCSLNLTSFYFRGPRNEVRCSSSELPPGENDSRNLPRAGESLLSFFFNDGVPVWT